MGSKIPKPIKLEVIRKWLEGKSRNKIAKEVGIGAGTVKNLIEIDRCLKHVENRNQNQIKQNKKETLIRKTQKIQKMKSYGNRKKKNKDGQYLKQSQIKPTESLGLMGNLVQKLNPGNLKDMVMELSYHPSKYLKDLKADTCMMDIYNLDIEEQQKTRIKEIAQRTINHLLKQLVPCKVTIGPNPVVLALIEVLKRDSE